MHNQQIIIYGTSILMMAIESILTERSGIHVVRLDPNLPDVAVQTVALAPAGVILEQNQANVALTLVLLNQKIPLVAIDAAQDTITVCYGRHQVQTTSIDNLAQEVEKIAGGSSSGWKGNSKARGHGQEKTWPVQKT